jgi:16S rRNA (guanine966-N2)-methyltransferase
VIDLFAGTGALGIEALSRGAREAVFVERSPAALRILRGNLEDLGLFARARVLPLAVERALGRLLPGPGYDLVLADPPYGSPFPAGRDAARLLRVLCEDGVLVIERARRDAPGPTPPGFALVASRAYGETVFERLKRLERSP